VFASMLGEYPEHALPEMRDDLVRLLQDEDIAPDPLSAAGWYLLSREAGWNAAASESECGSLAQFLGSNPLPSRCFTKVLCIIAGLSVC